MKDNIYLDIEVLKNEYLEKIHQRQDVLPLVYRLEILYEEAKKLGEWDSHLLEIHFQQIKARYINSFPDKNESKDFFNSISEWFIENEEMIADLIDESNLLKKKFSEESSVKDFSYQDTKAINTIKRVKNRISILNILKHNKIFLSNPKRHIFEYWIKILPLLI